MTPAAVQQAWLLCGRLMAWHVLGRDLIRLARQLDDILENDPTCGSVGLAVGWLVSDLEAQRLAAVTLRLAWQIVLREQYEPFGSVLMSQ